MTCFCQTSNGQVPAVSCFLRKFRLRRCYTKHGVGLGVVGWWGGGVVMLTPLAPAHMVNATQRMGWRWGGGV